MKNDGKLQFLWICNQLLAFSFIVLMLWWQQKYFFQNVLFQCPVSLFAFCFTFCLLHFCISVIHLWPNQSNLLSTHNAKTLCMILRPKLDCRWLTSCLLHCPAAPDKTGGPELDIFATEVIAWFFGGNRWHRRWVATRVERIKVSVWGRWGMQLRSACAQHISTSAILGEPPTFLAFSFLVDGCQTTLLPIYLLALKNLSFSPRTDLISMSRKMANVISWFYLLIAGAASVATAKRLSHFERMFSFCFFIRSKLLLSANDGCHCLFGWESNELKWNWLEKNPLKPMWAQPLTVQHRLNETQARAGRPLYLSWLRMSVWV